MRGGGRVAVPWRKQGSGGEERDPHGAPDGDLLKNFGTGAPIIAAGVVAGIQPLAHMQGMGGVSNIC